MNKTDAENILELTTKVRDLSYRSIRLINNNIINNKNKNFISNMIIINSKLISINQQLDAIEHKITE